MPDLKKILDIIDLAIQNEIEFLKYFETEENIREGQMVNCDEEKNENA